MAPANNGSALTDDIANRIEILAAEAGYGGLQHAVAMLNSVALLLRQLANPSNEEELADVSLAGAEPGNTLTC